jgi:hypothetical protein
MQLPAASMDQRGRKSAGLGSRETSQKSLAADTAGKPLRGHKLVVAVKRA